MKEQPLAPDNQPVTAIARHFANLADPRVSRTKEHDLVDIITIAICAFICGAEGWTDVEEFGRDKQPWLGTFLRLPNGIPSHDTFGRVFAMLSGREFAQCFTDWVKDLCEDLAGEVVSIDGKTLRRSLDKASLKSALHLVSAWAGDSCLSLGQVAVDDKSNEITAIPKLLKILDISGATVTIDAMGCQKQIARQIIEQDGDYVLAVKENQPALFDEVRRTMHEIADHPTTSLAYDYHESTDGGHGRVEVRKLWCTDCINEATARLDEWVGLHQFAMVERHRTVGETTSVERAYYIASHQHVSAKWLAHAIRSHWAIENKLHWSLDVAFDEDHCRVRTGHAAENMALLRKIALNLLKNEKTCKRGLAAKRLKAGWSHDYMLKVLQGGI